MNAEPDDAAGWLLLAKSYRHLDRIEDARAAYSRATALGKSDASLDSSLNADVGMASSGVEVRGRINISDEAADALNATDTIFVVAKAVGGSPMPLAVLRRQASELPFDFVLNEDTSMVPGLGLSSADQIVVSAKISRTGDALQTEQAFEVKSGAISTEKTDLPGAIYRFGVCRNAGG